MNGPLGTGGLIEPGRPEIGSGTTPFAWQHGFRLFLLEGGGAGWVLAELRFEPTACRYVEVRRTVYRWPREAAGALLSQTLVAGDSGADKAARDLIAWLATSTAGDAVDRRPN